MTVAELIAKLQALPQDIDVRLHDDEFPDQHVRGLQVEEWASNYSTPVTTTDSGYRCVVLYPYPLT